MPLGGSDSPCVSHLPLTIERQDLGGRPVDPPPNQLVDVKHLSQKHVSVTNVRSSTVTSPIPQALLPLISVLGQLQGPFPHNLSSTPTSHRQVGVGVKRTCQSVSLGLRAIGTGSPKSMGTGRPRKSKAASDQISALRIHCHKPGQAPREGELS